MRRYSDTKLSKKKLQGDVQRRVIFRYCTTIILSLILSLPVVAWPADMLGKQALKGLYKTNSYKEIVRALGGLEEWKNYQSFYLGLSHLQLGNTSSAIQAWKNYVDLEQGSEGGRKISKYLSILIQKEAKQTAKRAVSQERSLSRNFDPKAIAVLPFQNLGDQNYNSLSKGLAEMVITDLSNVKGLMVVERIKMQAILNELKLSKSALVDQKSAPRLGKLVGAGKITTGSFLDLKGEKMRLDATVTRTENGTRLTSSDARGSLSNFYRLEKILVIKILNGLGYSLQSLDSRTRLAIEKIHTKNLKAFQHYSEGLDLFDQGKYPEASRSFFLALEEDPRFGLARKSLLNTPIVRLNLTAMVAGAEGTEKGGAAVAETQAIVSAAKATKSTGPSKSSPAAVKKASSPIPSLPPITQQPVGNGEGSVSATSVPVTIQLQLP